MEGAHLHLLLNHFPVIGTIISTLVLIAGMVLKNDTIKKTALALVVFTALMTIPAFLSGEDAEEALKAIHQAPRDLIHEHEEMGDIGLWTTLLTGLIANFSMTNHAASVSNLGQKKYVSNKNNEGEKQKLFSYRRFYFHHSENRNQSSK